VNNLNEFKFKKVWLDSNAANAKSVTWVKPIQVELWGRKESDTKIADYNLTFPAPNDAPYTVELKEETIDGKTYNSYEFTISKISGDYDSFYVKEKGLNGYFTTYGKENPTAVNGKVSAEEGEYVTNSLIVVKLPDTGGPGTLIYSMLGMMLIAFAGTAYMILLRRRRASLKGGDNLR
jgi:LPXTG-motif cell wall-anchored protein